MANSVLSEPYFQDEQAAFDRLEAIIWPDGIVCPHCGSVGRAGALNGVVGKTGKPALGSKKGVSSNQLHRTLGVTLKTAWFMSHRLREAMRVLTMEPVGGAGKAVEVDETFIGQKRPRAFGARGYAHKHAVVSLVERGGRV